MAKKMSSDELMSGILSYIGFLVLIPLFVIKKRTTFANFHIQQGMNLFLLEVIVWVVGMVPVFGWALIPVILLVNLAFFILALIAILNAVQGKMWKMPFVHGLKLFDIKNLK